MTVHRGYANKSCPGDYLYNRHGEIAAEVNRRLNAEASPSTPETPKVLYRVQTGAFSVKSNADALAAKLKAKGFDTYMVKVNGNLYKVQVGAFSVKTNADAMAAKLKDAKGFDALHYNRKVEHL
jgi:cell division protein FtsN